MCGIIGIVNLDKTKISPDTLKKMTKMLEHRGPDGEGFYIDKNIGFGHRRLSVIDLSSAGHQPMVSQDKNHVISYNGEIYNYLEIRKELENLGYFFHSNTDTEVALYSYIEWNKDCLYRFNGMFAFSIWDRKNKILFLARDRYGIKPLYYTLQNNSFLFASEIKAFFKFPSFKANINFEGLQEYIIFQNYISYNTLFDQVKILPPATYLIIDTNSTKISEPQKYWNFNFNNNETIKDEKEYLEEFNRLFLQAIKRQLVGDVEIGSYLSGGIDSGSISAIASKEIPNLKTFTVGFFEEDILNTKDSCDERKKAENMSYLFNTEHYEYVLKPNDLYHNIKKLLWHIEEPRVGQSLPNYFAAKLSSKFVKVVLSGAGGDELFGGYPWRYESAIKYTNYNDYIKNYFKSWQKIFPVKFLKNLFHPIWNKINHVDLFELFKNKCKKHYIWNNNILCTFNFEAQTFLHGILIVEDKLSMAHSLETRIPFLDNDLVDFAQSLPISFKLKCTSNNNLLIGKYLIRKAMKKYVPNNISFGKKQGFISPKYWFQINNNSNLTFLIKNKKAHIYKFFNYPTIQKYFSNHKTNKHQLIWSLLNIEYWCQNFWSLK